jgi:hypothetical protein
MTACWLIAAIVTQQNYLGLQTGPLPFFFTIVQSFLQNKKIYRADCRCDIT